MAQSELQNGNTFGINRNSTKVKEPELVLKDVTPVKPKPKEITVITEPTDEMLNLRR